jgi:hypothetical protein
MVCGVSIAEAPLCPEHIENPAGTIYARLSAPPGTGSGASEHLPMEEPCRPA